MTQQKDLKKLVRARMEKTGESYTSARAQLMRKQQPKQILPFVAERSSRAGGSAQDDNMAALAGMSDAKIKAATGCAWQKWVKSLDHYGADKMSHGDIAKLVKEKYDTPSWWTQTITVGYERIKGLRAKGQSRAGTFEMTKSKTINVPVEELYDAWANARTRNRWLDGAKVKVRTATAPKSMRLDWPEGGIVAVGFVSKGENKSFVALEHAKLPDRETVTRLKQFWSERLDALKAELTT